MGIKDKITNKTSNPSHHSKVEIKYLPVNIIANERNRPISPILKISELEYVVQCIKSFFNL